MSANSLMLSLAVFCFFFFWIPARRCCPAKDFLHKIYLGNSFVRCLCSSADSLFFGRFWLQAPVAFQAIALGASLFCIILILKTSELFAKDFKSIYWADFSPGSFFASTSTADSGQFLLGIVHPSSGSFYPHPRLYPVAESLFFCLNVRLFMTFTSLPAGLYSPKFWLQAMVIAVFRML
jgi:hypothetical protein